MSVLKTGTVFAGRRSPDTHNEIIRVYTENGKKMVEVDQYGATLKNQNHQRKATFFAAEIRSALNNGNAHIVLVRR
jgi:hypothetical protein